MFLNRYRLQEEDKGVGGGGNSTDWRASFGAEAAPALKDFKEPGDFLKAFNDRSTELTSLKTNPQSFDWRKAAAGGDEKLAEQLTRITDLSALGKTWNDAQTRIRAGDLAKPLPKDAKPEQIAEWRRGNGIPEKPEGYFEKLPDGLVIGKDDLPLFQSIAADLHAQNASPSVVHAVAQWFYKQNAETEKADQALDKQHATEAQQELEKAWGRDAPDNLKIVDAYIDTMPEEVSALFQDATLPNGRRLLNDVKFMQWFAAQARENNPAGHILPPGSEGNIKSVDTEIATIEKVMREDRKTYNKDAAMQERLRQLYTARDKLKAKAA